MTYNETGALTIVIYTILRLMDLVWKRSFPGKDREEEEYAA